MSASLARYLKDFDAPEPVISAGHSQFDAELDNVLGRLDFTDLPQLPSPTHQEDIDNAFAEGRAAAIEELSAQHAEELAARDAAHQAELAQIRSSLEIEMSSVIAANFETISRQITSTLTDQVTQVLVPVLGAMLAEKAVAALAQKIIAFFEEPDGISLTIRGPNDLFSVFSEKIDGHGFNVKHIETKDIDLSVEFEDTVMVTRMSAWAEATRLLGS